MSTRNGPWSTSTKSLGVPLSCSRFLVTRVPCAIQSSQIAPAGAVDVVVADLGVDRGVNLDAGHLGAGEQPPDVDVVDVVAGDRAEDRAQAADDARLLAVGDVVVPHDVVADVLLGPAVLQGPVRSS